MPISKSKEANLYLALIFTLVQDYQKAAALLKNQGHKTTPYTSKEIKILQYIENIKVVTGDTDPNAAAIGAYAGFLLLKNSQTHQTKPPDLDSLWENFRSYLAWKNSVTSIKLNKQEELLILKSLLQTGFNPFYFMHLKKIDPAYAAELEFAFNPPVDEGKANEKNVIYPDSLITEWLYKYANNKPKFF